MSPGDSPALGVNAGVPRVSGDEPIINLSKQFSV